jgi:hypothetical protein
MPTTLSALGLPIGAPAPTVQRQFSMTLYLSDGLTLAAGKTGLWWSWWASVAAVRTSPPDASGSGATTNGSGVITLNAPNFLQIGNDQGYGIISDQDSTPDATEVAYTGTFDVTA